MDEKHNEQLPPVKYEGQVQLVTKKVQQVFN